MAVFGMSWLTQSFGLARTVAGLAALVLACVAHTAHAQAQPQAQTQAAPEKAAPAAPPALAETSCALADMQAIAQQIHHPVDRKLKVLEWLRDRSGDCSAAQLLELNANRPHWMGVADSAELAAIIYIIWDSKASARPALLDALYGPRPKEVKEVKANWPKEPAAKKSKVQEPKVKEAAAEPLHDSVFTRLYGQALAEAEGLQKTQNNLRAVLGCEAKPGATPQC
ncbi:MAG: hypothetical protein NTY26_14410 [Burkholderiales bacterium]|nr:hypothetical protein [Burkholderiales bacterium]